MILLAPLRLALIAVSAACGLVASSATAGDGSTLSWSNYQVDASHSGFAPVALGVNPVYSLRWSRAFEQGLPNPVAVADGRVFVTQAGYFNNVALAALDAEDGAILWSKLFDDVFSVNPPSHEGSRVYVQTGNHAEDTYLRAYDAATGDVIFQAPHTAQWERYYAPTVYENGVYVNGGYYGGMYAFNKITGERLWYAPLTQYDQWTPAVDADHAYAYTGGAGLTVLNRGTGEVVYEIADPGFSWRGWSMNLAPVLGQGTITVIQNGRVLCFDLVDHDIRWSNTGNYTGQPAVTGGVIYALAGASLAAHRESDGGLLWAWSAPRGETLEGAVTLTNDHAIVTSRTHTFFISLATRKTDFSIPAAGHIALAGGMVYVAGVDGVLYGFGKGAPTASAPVKLNFGKTKRGQARTADATLRNRGTADLKVLAVDGLTLPFHHSGTGLPMTIQAGGSGALTFTFAPGSRGRAKQTATVVTNDPLKPRLQITLVGKGS